MARCLQIGRILNVPSRFGRLVGLRGLTRVPSLCTHPPSHLRLSYYHNAYDGAPERHSQTPGRHLTHQRFDLLKLFLSCIFVVYLCTLL